jgi:hypothetical protein
MRNYFVDAFFHHEKLKLKIKNEKKSRCSSKEAKDSFIFS